MNPKIIVLALILLSLSTTAGAYANATCGNTASQGNISFNFTINGVNQCATENWFNITAVNVDTNITKNVSFNGTSNWSMSVRLLVNNTDNSTNYSVKIYGGSASSLAVISHNTTVQSNATGWIQYNITGLNYTGHINFTKLPGDNTRTSVYVYVAAFAAIIGVSGLYLRKIRKV